MSDEKEKKQSEVLTVPIDIVLGLLSLGIVIDNSNKLELVDQLLQPHIITLTTIEETEDKGKKEDGTRTAG